MANPSSKTGLGIRKSGWVGAGVLVLGLCAPALAQLPVKPPEQVRTEALARRASERLQALQREAERLASEERSLLGDLRKLEIERQLNAEELNRVNGANPDPIAGCPHWNGSPKG